ncbi:MAG TPA: hypothetical protein VKG86_09570 [Terracidiphilus sp.]|nr:hypothetical protein [Terracidiphilus sp.]
MSESEFLCLGVSRNCREYYAQGIELATGALVRLVGSRPDLRFNGLNLGQLRVEGMGSRRRMRPLDVVRLAIGERYSTRQHRENRILEHRLNDKPIPLIRNAAQDIGLVKEIREWAVSSSAAELLFNSDETSNPISNDDKFPMSFFIVESEHLWWRKTTEYIKNRSTIDLGSGPSIEGRFDFGVFRTRYCLPVGDIAWERNCATMIPGDRFIENKKLNEILNVPPELDTLLTISLDDDLIKFDRRFKFIAGILHLPKL